MKAEIGEAQRQLLIAAKRWWASRRPFNMSVRDHTDDPAVNRVGAERYLATVVARIVKAELSAKRGATTVHEIDIETRKVVKRVRIGICPVCKRRVQVVRSRVHGVDVFNWHRGTKKEATRLGGRSQMCSGSRKAL